MRISNFSRGAGKYLLVGLFIYLVLFVIIMIIRGDIFADSELSKLLFTEWRQNENFLTSYFASSLDSLVFFVLVGGAAILLSVKDPSDEVLFQKINYIFPQTQRDTALAKYIQDEISSLACVVTDCKRSISVRELSVCSDYLNIDIKGRSHIKNIFNNHEFVSDNMKFSMTADPVAFSDIWGEVLDAAIICDVKKPSDSKQSLNGTKVLTKDTASFSTSFPLNLAPNESVLYSTHGWFWQKITNHINFGTSRFMEKAIYEITNDSNNKVRFTVESNKLQFNFSEKVLNKIKSLLSSLKQSPEDEDKLAELISPTNSKGGMIMKEYLLEPNETQSIIFSNIVPSDTIRFYFKPEKLNENGKTPD